MLHSVWSLWLDAFGLFRWKRFEEFFLTTLKTFFCAGRNIVNHFWWLLIIMFTAEVFSFHYVYALSALFYSFFCMLAVRPSVERKDYSYYFDHIKKFPSYCLIVGIFATLLLVPFKVSAASTWQSLPLYEKFFFYGPYFLIFITGLFYLDMPFFLKNICMAIKNCFLFCFDFLPTIVLFFLFEVGVFYIINDVLQGYVTPFSREGLAIGSLFCLSSFVLQNIIYIFYLSLLSIFYVRTKYNYHELFFGGCFQKEQVH